MKCYLLLRNNQESGPYSLDDLKQKTLRPTDLVWKEGQSTQWSNPQEYPELKELVKKQEVLPLNLPPRRASSPQCSHYSTSMTGHRAPVCVLMPKDKAEKYNLPLSQGIRPAVHTSLPSGELHTAGTERKFQFQKSSRGNGLWIVGLMISLIMGAIVVKKVVDGFDESKPQKEALAVAVIPTMALPEGRTSEDDADRSFHNALTTEVINRSERVTSSSNKIKVNEKELQQLITLSSNNYNVNTTGGIEDLQLTVSNDSDVDLSKVDIQLQYQLSSGKPVLTEHMSIKDLEAKGKTTIHVAPVKTGVKVVYKVLEIDTEKPVPTAKA